MFNSSNELWSISEIKSLIEKGRVKYINNDLTFTENHKSSFIKFLLLGANFGEISLVSDINGVNWVCDGINRITTIMQYIKGEFGCDSIYFKDLKPIDQGRLEDMNIKIIKYKPPFDLSLLVNYMNYLNGHVYTFTVNSFDVCDLKR